MKGKKLLAALMLFNFSFHTFIGIFFGSNIDFRNITFLILWAVIFLNYKINSIKEK